MLSFELWQFLLVGGMFALDVEEQDGWQQMMRDKVREMGVTIQYETQQEWEQRMQRARNWCDTDKTRRRRCDHVRLQCIDAKQYHPYLSIRKPLTRQQAASIGCLF
jgi:hypothetical protein